MYSKQYAPQPETHILDSRIQGLGLEERGAARRRASSAATNIALSGQ